MKPVSIPTLKDYVTDTLRGEIFSGRMADGEELTQESVAEQLGVSRLPVREAFLQLQSEGLLRRLPNRHIQVVGITAARLWQNFHVLAAIESEIALQLVAEGKTAQPGNAYFACQNAYDRQDWDGLREAEGAFHLSLSAALGNDTLHRLHENQRRVLFGGIMQQLCPDWQKMMRLNEDIWRAVRAKSESSVRTCIYEYYTSLAGDAAKELKL